MTKQRKKAQPRSLIGRALSQLTGKVAVAMLLIVVIMAILGATVMVDPATVIDPMRAYKPISWEHWLGTDSLGRDNFARIAYATPLSLLLALTAALIGIVGGITLGSLSWFSGPRVGNFIAAAIRIAIAFPSLLLVLFASVVFGQGTVGSVLAVGVAMIPWYGRLVLNLVNSVREREYVSAALIQGQSRTRILLRYIMPNVGEPLIVNGTLSAGGALLAFAGLSFLGLGVQAPQYDWGLLLNQNLLAIYVTPAPALCAALMIVIAGLGFNLLGESFAKSLDSERPAAFTERPTVPKPVEGADENIVASVKGLSINARNSSGETIHIVKGIDLEVPVGRIIGIVGESGSGKTLTAQAIAQVADESLEVQAATLTIDGISYLGAGASEDSRLVDAVGYIFQDSGSSFNPVMRFDSQVPEALLVRDKLSRKKGYEITVEQFEKVGVPDSQDRAKQYPHEFSGGMRQRAMIAQATAPTPRLVIADEPTTALDVSLKGRILALLRSLRDEDGASIIIISHDISAILTIVDDILVMYGGEVIERGTAQMIRENPQHPYTKALLEAVPSMTTPKDEPLRTITERPGGTAASAIEVATAATVAPRLSTETINARIGGKSAGDLVYENVSIVYGRGHSAFTAVRDFSLEVPSGSIMGIVGESGSGKSTLAKATVGLVPVREGSIRLDGKLLTNTRSRGAIQMVFQDPYASLNPRMTIGRSIQEGLKVNRNPEFTVDELLQLVDLDPERRSQLPKDFSGGQRQRIALARALAAGPELLIADEITSALDVSVQGSVINLLLDLQRRLGFSVLFISHDLPVVRYVSDRIAVMYRGELVEVGETDQIVGAPVHPYTIQLLEASSALSGA